MGDMVVGISLLTQGKDQFTGTATYVRGLLRELARAEQIRVEVLCNEYAASVLAGCESPTMDLIPASGIRGGTSRSGRVTSLVRARLASERLAGQFTDEVGVVHFPLTLGIPYVRLPTVVSLHDVQHHDLPQYFSAATRAWRRVMYDAPARKASLVHTLSSFSKTRISDKLNIAPDRIVVIPLAVDQDRFRPQVNAEEDRLLGPLGLPSRFLFYPASLWPHKNHHGLLDALSLCDDGDMHLVLCGAHCGRLDELREAAARLSIGSRVHHMGVIPDEILPAVYRRATALVFPSTYEGFGTPPLEAMASGCPVASSLVGPLAEVCGDAAIELVPNDRRQMAEAIDRLVWDRPLRAKLRAAGFVQAGRFSWTEVARAHLAAYSQAINAR